MNRKLAALVILLGLFLVSLLIARAVLATVMLCWLRLMLLAALAVLSLVWLG